MAEIPDNLNFSVDSRLLEELGENLVTRNHIALSELIKNAYDADATEVTVKFSNALTEEKPGEIHIIDNGNGMTFEEVRKNWMRIATTEKIRNPVSPKFGRKKTGNKGIGRFACRRLANKLKLEAIGKVESGKLQRTVVNFDWADFERGENIEEIDCKVDDNEIIEEGVTGLTLKLVDLRDKWTQRNFHTLRRNVLMLSVSEPTRREGYKEDPGFDIMLEASEFELGEGLLLDQFMEAGWGTLKGEIETDGVVSLELEAKKIGKKSYELPEKFPELGPGNIRFEIAHIPIKKQYYRDAKTLSKTGAKKITKEQGGVRVYLDGFRVYPYGDPEEDWLGIDKMSAARRGKPDDSLEKASENLKVEFGSALYNHPRTQNLVGKIHIESDQELPLQVKMDREGFVENEAFEDLRNMLKLSLQWLTLHYNHFKKIWDEEKLKKESEKLKEETEREEEEQKEDSSTVDTALDVIDSVTENASRNLSEGEMEVSDEAMKTATRVVRSSLDQKQSEINFLRSAFSVNQLVFGFTHELRSLVARLERYSTKILNVIERIPNDERKEFKEISNSLSSTKDRFQQQIELFGIFMESSQDEQRKRIRVKEAVAELTDTVEYVSSFYGIDVNTEIPITLKTRPMFESELFSIIINLVTNSIKAVIANEGGEILVEGFEEDEKTIIRVYDNGIGLSEDYHSDVFNSLVADPEGKLYKRLQDKMPNKISETVGTGSGLGLNIVQSIVENYGGTAKFIDPEGPWETCVEVQIP